MGDVKGMLIDVLNYWLETDPRKSWSKLAEAVEDCGNTVLAEKIRQVNFTKVNLTTHLEVMQITPHSIKVHTTSLPQSVLALSIALISPYL